MGPYVEACIREIGQARAEGMEPATSVFFGGGTPSLLPAEMLVSILDAIPRARGAEVTVECNPETVSAGLLGAYRDAGVSRLSFGVQSMDIAVLASLGRRHDPGAVHEAARLAGDSGFGESYSVDLIYGAAAESLSGWRATLNAVLALEPAPRHVSAYALTVEAGTPLAAEPARHPDGDDQAEKYLLADRILAEAGMQWYEISNWSAPGAECRHNRLYWLQGDYRGIGCSAHSHQTQDGGGSRRWWNVRTPDRYQRLVAEGKDVVAAGESLDAGTRRMEGLQLLLRTRMGVPAGALEDDPAIDGLVEVAGGRAVLTPRGRLLANEVALRLVG